MLDGLSYSAKQITCIRYIFVIIQLIITSIGSVFIYASITVDYLPVVTATKVLGGAIIVLSLYGVMTALIHDRRWLYIIYSVSTCVVFISLLTLAAVISSYLDDTMDVLRAEMMDYMILYRDSSNSRAYWNDMQREYNCCAIDNFTDWRLVFTTWPDKIPESCCRDGLEEHGESCAEATRNPDSTKVYEEGCHTKILAWRKQFVIYGITFSLVTGALSVIAICLSIILYTSGQKTQDIETFVSVETPLERKKNEHESALEEAMLEVTPGKMEAENTQEGTKLEVTPAKKERENTQEETKLEVTPAKKETENTQEETNSEVTLTDSIFSSEEMPSTIIRPPEISLDDFPFGSYGEENTSDEFNPIKETKMKKKTKKKIKKKKSFS